jgi:hypothetical protein
MAVSPGAVADGDILSLTATDGSGSFGIAEVRPAATTCTDWFDVTVTDLTYGSGVDEKDPAQGTVENYDAPQGDPNAQRSCDNGTPGSLLRVSDSADLSFGSTITLNRTDGTFQGGGGGNYKIRPPVGGTAPEPGSLALLAIGLGAAGAAGIARRRRRR